MADIATGATLGFLIIMQGLIIWECVKMKGHVSTHSLDLKTELGTMAELVDEACDLLANLPAGASSSFGALSQPSTDLKEMLLTSIISKITMPSEHGSKAQQEDRQNDEGFSTQVETEIESS